MKIDPEAEQKFRKMLDEIHQGIDSDQATGIELKIHERGHTALDLFESRFSFSDIKGQLSEIKLRCRNKFQQLDFNADAEYEIPKSWGHCQLQVIGEAGTEFVLVQR